MGHTVNFRTVKESYKSKQITKRPQEDWVIIENTHEAIVDPETWKLAQYTRRTVHRVDKTGAANPFTGLVFCADCGAKMYNHRGQPNPNKPDGGRNPETGLYPYDHYDCSTYSLTMNRVEKCHRWDVIYEHMPTSRSCRRCGLKKVIIESETGSKVTYLCQNCGERESTLK